MILARGFAIAAALGVGLVTAGCGSGKAIVAKHPGSSPSGVGAPPRPEPGPVPRVIPAPAPTGRPADPTAVAVIRGWSTALRHGNVRVAARYFALPSLLANGAGAGGGLAVIAIRTVAQADAANATLPCGAELISADQRGRYVNALFRLTNRPGAGGGCAAGAGQTARTNFVIRGAHIVEWIRAPDDPGDNSGAPPPTQTPRSPGPQTPSPVI